MKQSSSHISTSQGWLAISPIIVFLTVYLCSSLLLKDFYAMPISVAMLISSLWAIVTLKGKSLTEKIEVFSKGAAVVNVMYMIWIFILAGAFACLAKETGSVEATVEATFNILPSSLIVPGLFLLTCFISMAIGTSVGTVVALIPIAVEMASSSHSSIAFFVAIVLGGAFFGDNLSFISDTTIAATRTQGCNMRDKFFANIKIVIPAAIVALILYSFTSSDIVLDHSFSGKSPWLMTPYIMVIVLAILGLNVTVVLLMGILAAVLSGLLQGMDFFQLCRFSGEGIESVGGLIIITLLASGLLGVIKEAGGINFIINLLNRNISTRKGAEGSIVVLVGIVNLCTANNTVAIITVGTMVKKISAAFSIPAKRSASLLDTGACIIQALIPYGAQTLMASSLSGVSPISFWPYLYYPQILIVFLLVSILFCRRKNNNE